MLPKIELHAHLSGCVRQDTLCAMAARRNLPTFQKFDVKAELTATTEQNAPKDDDHDEAQASRSSIFERAMKKCFAYFETVARVVTDLDALEEATRDVLDAFLDDGCVYLELRTTPKKLLQKNSTTAVATSKEADYVRTVRDVCASPKYTDELHVRLLLSVDRGKIKSFEDAQKQIKCCLALYHEFAPFVVGLDICGNPAVDSVVPYLLPALLEAKDEHDAAAAAERASEDSWPLVTFHLGEDISHTETEVDAVLDCASKLNIRRVGHVCFLTAAQRERVKKLGLGVELCPTSNCVTRSLSSFSDHHFPEWHSSKVSFCTDDTGLFGCSLSSELAEMKQAFGLSQRDLMQLQLNALEMSFLPHADPQRQRIRQKIRTAWTSTCEEEDKL
ncbi:unnamed protein product [Amoebophrya sp. A25]|nr:unnamed protein product [Amoebophrya sp. A25]|eukprot:GSA25T00019110001.1